MSSYEEIQTSAIDMFLIVNDISEKTNKFHGDDIEKFVTTAVTSKRVSPLVKKIYDLETAIGKFRSELRRVIMLNAKSGLESILPGAEDPIDSNPELTTTCGAGVELVLIPVSSTESLESKIPEKPKKGGKKDEKVGDTAAKDEKPAKTGKEEKSEKEEKSVKSEKVVKSEKAEKVEKYDKTEKLAKSAKVEKEKSEKADKAEKPTKVEKAEMSQPVLAVPTAAPVNDVVVESVSKKTKLKKSVETSSAALTPAPDSVSTDDEDDSKIPLSARRKKIPKAVRILVWNLHVGSHKGEDRCMCCKEKKIDVANFHCGHVIAETKGGDLTIKNLRPICSACNSAMGTRSMNEFTKEFFGWEI